MGIRSFIANFPRLKPNRLVILILVSLASTLTGCKTLVGNDQSSFTNQYILKPGESIGQTFVARYDGLNALHVYVGPLTQGNGNLLLHLRENAQATTDLAVSKLPVNAITEAGYIPFTITPQKDSRRQYYYAFLEIQGDGEVQVFGAPGDAYLDGSIYKNSTPLEGQMAFHLGYEPGLVFWGLMQLAITWAGVTSVGIFLFIIPGWALLSLLWSGWHKLRWAEKLGLAGGLSLAIYPLLMLWTNLIGLRIGALYAWLPALLCLIILVWRNYKNWDFGVIKHLRLSAFDWPDLAYLLIIGMIVITRLWVIRNLDAPMFGDSYQHTLIAQLIVNNNGLFNSWQPYTELQTFTYHFGFHSAVAVFHWVTQLALPRATLWTGQFVNILAVLSLYPLAVKVGKSRWSGVAAVLIAGLISSMPMFYLNWGRYTQLSGQAILPVAVVLSMASLEGGEWKLGRKDWGILIISWVALAGLALAHYRVLVFAVLFFVAFFVIETRKSNWRGLIIRTSWIGIGAGLLFLPWFIHIFGGRILSIFASQVSTPAQSISSSTQDYNAIGNLTAYLPALIWLLLPVSAAWGLWKRVKGIALVSLWWFLILLAANPQWLNLPGAGSISSFTVLIAAYIPASILIGSSLGWLAESIEGASSRLRIEGLIKSPNINVSPHWAVSLLFFFVLIAAGAWGVSQRFKDLDVRGFAMVTRPDIRAAAWIEQNTPQNSRFLVNSFLAFGDTTLVGSDSGWWLPLLAHRKINLPPINYGFEKDPWPGYRDSVNGLWTEIQMKGINAAETLASLKGNGITHIYIGQRQGRVNYNGPEILNPEQLMADPNFHSIYHQDRVWVFELAR